MKILEKFRGRFKRLNESKNHLSSKHRIYFWRFLLNKEFESSPRVELSRYYKRYFTDHFNQVKFLFFHKLYGQLGEKPQHYAASVLSG
jgi:hypothetical protein